MRLTTCVVTLQAPGKYDFFNRQHEMKCLTDLLSHRPAALTVIVGPASSGKTALVKQYIKQLDPDRTALPIYIDCREADVQTPEYLAETLLRITASLNDRLPAFAGDFLTAVAKTTTRSVKFGEVDIIVDLEKVSSWSELPAALTAKPGSSALARVLEMLQQGLAAGTKKRRTTEPNKWPAIIIDEANALMSWTTTHPQELRTLLRFFVNVTKQENTAHVLLLTTDCAFIDWLQHRELCLDIASILAACALQHSFHVIFSHYKAGCLYTPFRMRVARI